MAQTAGTTSAEGPFLAGLFDLLNAAGIGYAVMRNAEPLPDGAGGSDLDLLVTRRDEVRAKAVLFEAIERAGGAPIGAAETVGFFKVHALGRAPAPHRGAWWGLAVDVNVGVAFRGHALVADDVPWPVRRHRGVVVLADGFGAVLGVLKEVLYNDTVPARYRAAAARALTEEWPAMAALLAPMGAVALERLRALVVDGEPTPAGCRDVRRAFLRHGLATRPRRYADVTVRRALSNVRRLLRPSGKLVAILGVDGAGKSTIIDAIKPVLDEATHHGTVVRHLRPTLLPPLAQLFGRGSRAGGGPVVDPHGSEPSGMVGSALRLSYLSLDYVLGYWLVIRPELARKPAVVLFDRYAYDMALDPRRFRLELPAPLLRRVTGLAPVPDLILCLHGRPEALVARKKELPLTEVKRQLEALEAFARGEPRAVLVSTEGTVEEARDDALEALRAVCAREAASQR